jgi:hypothetical protein
MCPVGSAGLIRARLCAKSSASALRRFSAIRGSLHWIEGTERRFDGYNFFGVHPELPIEWFDKHVT